MAELDISILKFLASLQDKDEQKIRINPTAIRINLELRLGTDDLKRRTVTNRLQILYSKEFETHDRSLLGKADVSGTYYYITSFGIEVVNDEHDPKVLLPADETLNGI
jgi:hypothetical protein